MSCVLPWAAPSPHKRKRLCFQPVTLARQPSTGLLSGKRLLPRNFPSILAPYQQHWASSTLQLQHVFKFLQRRWGACGEFPFPFILVLVSSPWFLLKMAVGIRTGKLMCLIFCFWELANVFVYLRQCNIKVRPAVCHVYTCSCSDKLGIS